MPAKTRDMGFTANSTGDCVLLFRPGRRPGTPTTHGFAPVTRATHRQLESGLDLKSLVEARVRVMARIDISLGTLGRASQ